MEELGIGRPSTYAPIISTIQQRQYVTRGDKEGTERKYDVITLKGGNITETTKTEITGAERNKLFPTDVGIVVTDFLDENFPEIMDYNFTADVENNSTKWPRERKNGPVSCTTSTRTSSRRWKKRLPTRAATRPANGN